jgi:transcriptional regulator with XRE-family HTH domain
MTAEELVAALDAERVKQEVSFYELSKRTGLDAIGVTRILAGERVPGLPHVIKIAEALGLTVSVKKGKGKP